MKIALLALSSASLLFLTSGCCCPPPDTTCGPESVLLVPETPPPAKPAPVVAAEPSPDERIRLSLQKKKVKGLSWEELNLDNAVTYLRVITGHNFYISPKVREEKFDDIVISAQLDDVNVATVLSVILTEPFDMRWEVREGVVWILTNEEVDGPAKLRYYDVKDLAPGDEGFLGRKVGEAPAKEPDRAAMERLVEDIREEVHPGYWDREGTTIEGRNGILIVRASRGVQDALERFLAQRRNAQVQTDVGPILTPKFAATQVNLAVKEQTLGEVLKTLQIMSGFNLMIDPRCAADVAKNPVSAMKLEGAPLMTALAMLAAAAGDGYLWRGEGNVAVLTHREFLGK